MITYEVEEVANVLDEVKPLLEKHWNEIALHKDNIALKPDYDKYLLLDKMNMLQLVTARDDGKLIGYFVSFIQPHMHYKDNLFAMNDILYIDPEYRKGSVGYKLFKHAEKFLKEVGVDVIMIHSKVKNDFKPLMDRLGFERVEYTYSKYIGDK